MKNPVFILSSLAVIYGGIEYDSPSLKSTSAKHRPKMKTGERAAKREARKRRNIRARSSKRKGVAA